MNKIIKVIVLMLVTMVAGVALVSQVKNENVEASQNQNSLYLASQEYYCFEQGTYNETTFEKEDSTSIIRVYKNVEILDAWREQSLVFYTSSDTMVKIYAVDTEGASVGVTDWQNSGYSYTIPATADELLYTIKKSDNATFKYNERHRILAIVADSIEVTGQEFTAFELGDLNVTTGEKVAKTTTIRLTKPAPLQDNWGKLLFWGAKDVKVTVFFYDENGDLVGIPTITSNSVKQITTLVGPLVVPIPYSAVSVSYVVALNPEKTITPTTRSNWVNVAVAQTGRETPEMITNKEFYAVEQGSFSGATGLKDAGTMTNRLRASLDRLELDPSWTVISLFMASDIQISTQFYRADGSFFGVGGWATSGKTIIIPNGVTHINYAMSTTTHSKIAPADRASWLTLVVNPIKIEKPSYEQGGIDVNGNEFSNDKMARVKDAIALDKNWSDLTFHGNKDVKISVAFYDENQKLASPIVGTGYIEKYATLSAGINVSIPQNATSFKYVVEYVADNKTIIPNDCVNYINIVVSGFGRKAPEKIGDVEWSEMEQGTYDGAGKAFDGNLTGRVRLKAVKAKVDPSWSTLAFYFGEDVQVSLQIYYADGRFGGTGTWMPSGSVFIIPNGVNEIGLVFSSKSSSTLDFNSRRTWLSVVTNPVTLNNEGFDQFQQGFVNRFTGVVENNLKSICLAEPVEIASNWSALQFTGKNNTKISTTYFDKDMKSIYHGTNEVSLNSPFVYNVPREAKYVQISILYTNNIYINPYDVADWVTVTAVQEKTEDADKYYYDVVANEMEPTKVITNSHMDTWQGANFVNGQLWTAKDSADGHISTNGFVRVFNMNYEENKATYVSTFTHNFGHLNSFAYQSCNNTLIFGNGSGNNVQPPYFFTANVANFNLSALNTLDSVGAVKFVMPYWFGGKVNVIWTDTDHEAMVVSDEGTTFRRIRLGLGSEQLEHGLFNATASADEYNGTFEVLRTDCIESAFDCVQGCAWIHGKLVIGIGHGPYEVAVVDFLDEGITYKIQQYDNTMAYVVSPVYDETTGYYGVQIARTLYMWNDTEVLFNNEDLAPEMPENFDELVNLDLSKSIASCTTTEIISNSASAAFDNNDNTFYKPDYNKTEETTLIVDLGEIKNISQVILKFENLAVYKTKINYSRNGDVWYNYSSNMDYSVTAKTIASSKNVYARYVAVIIPNAILNQNGDRVDVSIAEMQVIEASSNANIALGKACSASSMLNSGYSIFSAIDGDGSTRYCASDARMPQTFFIDIGSVVDVEGMLLKFQQRACWSATIMVSTDGVTYENYYELSETAQVYIVSNSQKARYIKVTVTDGGIDLYGSFPWVSLYDFEVYAKQPATSVYDNLEKDEVDPGYVVEPSTSEPSSDPSSESSSESNSTHKVSGCNSTMESGVLAILVAMFGVVVFIKKRAFNK